MGPYPKEPLPLGPVYHSETSVADLTITHTAEEAGRLPDVPLALAGVVMATVGVVGRLIAKLDTPISGR